MIGTIVLYKMSIPDGQSKSPDFPAIIYKYDPVTEIAGLTVFIEGIPQRLGHVTYSRVPMERTWRFKDGEYNEESDLAA